LRALLAALRNSTRSGQQRYTFPNDKAARRYRFAVRFREERIRFFRSHGDLPDPTQEVVKIVVEQTGLAFDTNQGFSQATGRELSLSIEFAELRL